MQIRTRNHTCRQTSYFHILQRFRPPSDLQQIVRGSILEIVYVLTVPFIFIVLARRAHVLSSLRSELARAN
jgi:hypothetical protein